MVDLPAGLPPITSQKKEAKSVAQLKCESDGGKWNPTTKTCTFPEKGKVQIRDSTPQETAQAGFKPDTPPVIPPTGVPPTNDPVLSLAREKGISVKAAADILAARAAQSPQKQLLRSSTEAQNAEAGQREFAAEGQTLAEQIGTQPSPETDPTNLSQTEALVVGAREAIPRAITLAGTAIGAGFVASPATGGTSAVAGVIGGALIFSGTIASSALNNMKSQRTDNTNAQQRVLDEGKQTLQDWVTQAAADPSNRQFYVNQFNSQLQLIQNAHVQMLTDTNADFSKYETAIPNLAEFNSFYNEGGERDALVTDMQRALTGQIDFQELNFRMMALAVRSGDTNVNIEQPKSFIGGLIP